MEDVTIIGAGVSGRAAAELCGKLGLDCSLLSDGDDPGLTGSGLIVVSPGVHPGRSALYKAALASGREVISEMEFGFRYWKRPLLGITGTNGKTTTTELTCHLLRACGIRAETAGNIGRPLSDLAAEPGDCSMAVVEVSSFQLERISRFSPDAAAIINFASDHIDRYPGGFAEYCAVKEKIFNGVRPENRIYGLSFGGRSRRVTLADGRLMLDGGEFFDLADSDLPGFHNGENAAVAVELALRVLPEPVVRGEIFAEALRSFRRGRHRVETIGIRGGVRLVDDSKGTNPAAVLAAVDSLPGKLVILLGGLGKGMDFTPLSSRAGRFRAAVLYGADREDIGRVLSGLCPCHDCGSDFGEAVRRASELAEPGDTVLLSPACASMDMFRNYAERGDRFAELCLASRWGSQRG